MVYGLLHRKENNMEKIKIHARVTREIEVTALEANILIGLSMGTLDDSYKAEAKRFLQSLPMGSGPEITKRDTSLRPGFRRI